MLPGSRFRDIVLPAASFLEFDDLTSSYFHLTVGAQVKCAEPMGESLPNQEIFRRLSRAMGFEDALLYRDDASMLDSDEARNTWHRVGWMSQMTSGMSRISGKSGRR